MYSLGMKIEIEIYNDHHNPYQILLMILFFYYMCVFLYDFFYFFYLFFVFYTEKQLMKFFINMITQSLS